MRSNRMNVPAGFWAGLQRLGIDPYDVVRKARYQSPFSQNQLQSPFPNIIASGK
ncbi:hypothetical protein SAMN05518846_121108 [Brevibacillus centrosporus]|uniref:Uncharacterized protein n=1 Tax=Brevibacillus centrosporus TaxID=54910 RepID=A0A1I4CWF9_9BACL|nr:hypothetical protein SAMN05518846_121108 [Brevibacillus centrosporus]